MNLHLVNLIKNVLKPLIQLLLFFGIDYKLFDAIVKNIFVSIAAKNYGIRSRETNISRISLMTGITRKEVVSVKNRIINEEEYFRQFRAPAMRLLDIWLKDDVFLDSHKKPKQLKYNSGKPSFIDLAKKAKLDAAPKAVYLELERLDVIKKDSNGSIFIKNYQIISESKEEILTMRLKGLVSNNYSI
jgi:hypothetical protein